jgi:hypothetical protein
VNALPCDPCYRGGVIRQQTQPVPGTSYHESFQLSEDGGPSSRCRILRADEVATRREGIILKTCWESRVCDASGELLPAKEKRTAAAWHTPPHSTPLSKSLPTPFFWLGTAGARAGHNTAPRRARACCFAYRRVADPLLPCCLSQPQVQLRSVARTT